MTYNEHFLKGIKHFQKVSDKAQKGVLIYAGELQFENELAKVINFSGIYQVFV